MWYRIWLLMKNKRLIRVMDNSFPIEKRTACTVDNKINLFSVLCVFKRYCLLVPDIPLGTGDVGMEKHK